MLEAIANRWALVAASPARIVLIDGETDRSEQIQVRSAIESWTLTPGVDRVGLFGSSELLAVDAFLDSPTSAFERNVGRAPVIAPALLELRREYREQPMQVVVLAARTPFDLADWLDPSWIEWPSLHLAVASVGFQSAKDLEAFNKKSMERHLRGQLLHDKEVTIHSDGPTVICRPTRADPEAKVSSDDPHVLACADVTTRLEFPVVCERGLPLLPPRIESGRGWLLTQLDDTVDCSWQGPIQLDADAQLAVEHFFAGEPYSCPLGCGNEHVDTLHCQQRSAYSFRARWSLPVIEQQSRKGDFVALAVSHKEGRVALASIWTSRSPALILDDRSVLVRSVDGRGLRAWQYSSDGEWAEVPIQTGGTGDDKLLPVGSIGRLHSSELGRESVAYLLLD